MSKNLKVSRSVLVWTWLALFSAKGTKRSDLFNLLRLIYHDLFTWVVSAEFPRAPLMINTNMEMPLVGIGIKSKVPVTIVDIIRAGMRPTLMLHEFLLHSGVIAEELVHEHHITASRLTNKKGRVTGVAVDFSKADEPVKPGSIVVIPDPMFASGLTVTAVISHYKEKYPDIGKFVVVCMIATPKGVRHLHSIHPDVVVYAARKDPRLNKKSYIEPGAGGVGELLTGTKK